MTTLHEIASDVLMRLPKGWAIRPSDIRALAEAAKNSAPASPGILAALKSTIEQLEHIESVSPAAGSYGRQACIASARKALTDAGATT